ncbi:ribonuclease H-like domain-containing protein [Mycena vitilis]|nr:ribonuclease H-like domain-containing protein [Mycena vitilis]
MPPKGPLWDFFYPGEKQNTAHYRAICLGCIRHHRQAQNPPNDTDAALKARLVWGEATFTAARAVVGSVSGVKSSMLAHLVGASACEYASSQAKKKAVQIKAGKAVVESSSDIDGDDESDSQPKSKKRKKIFLDVSKAMKQPELKVYRGANIPFSADEEERLRLQFARATISANLPFRWTEDVEVIKLFIMFRSTAGDVIPSREVISGSLLDRLSATVEKHLRTALKGVNILRSLRLKVGPQSYLIDLIKANGHKKDGVSMCAAFEGMIDKAENTYRCIVVLFCCDNDGGSQRGRKDLAIKRPWLLIAPCCAHQGQLMLGDYFYVNFAAADIAEQTIELIHWILSHDRVRKIFDDAQHTKNFVVLVYLLANLTRWTTHYVAFRRFVSLRVALRHAAYLYRQDIIEAQVGAEKNRKAVNKITAQVNVMCNRIENNDYWDSLQGVVDDIEPICYATNINQGDRTRADQVLLTFAGVFLHFSAHENRAVSKGMLARIEKRWAALDQPLFVLCLILNPYEGLERFGDKSGINVFVLTSELVALFRRIRSRPRPEGEMQDDAQTEAQVSTAFMQYLAGTGPFAAWEEHKKEFQERHLDQPHLMWEQMRRTEGVVDLAEFAILLLGLVVNQAATERTFSDLKIKKTRLRNRLRTEKLEKIIREENLAAGLIHARAPRTVHDPTKVAGLMSVPRYADALEDDGDEDDGGDGSRPSKLVKTAATWRVELERWIGEALVEEDDESDGAGSRAVPILPQKAPGKAKSKFLPRSLALLFGGKVKNPVAKPPAEQFTREGLMMELLAAEESDEEPDDGALSGSGDDFMM